MNEFYTVKDEKVIEIEVEKSKFIGILMPFFNKDNLKNEIEKIKIRFPKARHYCYAFVLDNEFKYSDDGEPQGTAGIPILEVMKKSNVTDCAVVVTRYFGGILLGAGGLTRAYTKGASIAIKSAGVVEKVKGLKISFEMEYDLFGKVQYICGQNLWHIEETEYADKVIVHILCEENMADAIEGEIVEASSGKVIVRRSEEGIYFKEEHRLYAEI